MAGVHAPRIASVPRHSPDSLFRSRRITGGIWHLARRILRFAAHIGNGIAVSGEIHSRQFLPVILVVFRKLPRRKTRPFGNPNIPPAFLIERPSDAIAFFRCRQIRWEGRAQHLLQRERFLRARSRRQNQQTRCTQKSQTIHRSSPSVMPFTDNQKSFEAQSAGRRTSASSTETFGPSSGPEIFSTCPAPESFVLRSLLLGTPAVSIARSALRPKLSVPFTSVNCFPESR